MYSVYFDSQAAKILQKILKKDDNSNKNCYNDNRNRAIDRLGRLTP